MSKSKARSLRRKRAQKRKKAAMKRGVDAVHVVHEEKPKSQDKDHNVAPSSRGNEGAPSAKKKRKHRRKKNKAKVTEEGKIDDAKNKPKVHEEGKIDIVKNKPKVHEDGKIDVKNKTKAAKEGKRDVVKNKQKVPKEGKINAVKNKQKGPEEGKINDVKNKQKLPEEGKIDVAVNCDNTAPTKSAARPKGIPDVKAKVEISKPENTSEIENVNPVKVDDLPVKEETIPQVVEESVTKPVETVEKKMSPSELEPPIDTQVSARKPDNARAIVYDDDNETNKGKNEDCACACVIM